MIFQTKAKLIKNIKVTPEYYKISLFCPQITRNANPGQFVEIKVSEGDELLLRRPFSIHKVVSQLTSEIFYKVMGKGTELLSEKKPGELLDIIGPLGNGFDYERRATNDERLILVAGGIGVAPLFFLAEKLQKRATFVLIGAKTKTQILCEKEFKKIGCDVKIATDDGSRGFKGRVTDLLKYILSKNSRTQELKNSRTLFACGPRLMLKEISHISKEYNIPAQISLEEHLACGIGACLGCVVKTQNAKRKTQNDFKYKRVCKEGPVFDAQEIIWDNARR